MNIDVIVHPKLQHYGIATANGEAMIAWYHKVLGMTPNFRFTAPGGAQAGPPFSATFVSNDEVHHRIVFFDLPELAEDSEKLRLPRVQHVAFEYQTLDDLLGTYARLKGLNILPVMAVDEGLQTGIYYNDPDQNSVELNVNNYGNEWTATEHMRTALSSSERPRRMFVDPEKMYLARKAGASPWELHERAMAGEFAPEKAYDRRTLL